MLLRITGHAEGEGRFRGFRFRAVGHYSGVEIGYLVHKAYSMGMSVSARCKGRFIVRSVATENEQVGNAKI